jgi:DNA helicase-2/ATP-dependent DNA helicase PcrA
MTRAMDTLIVTRARYRRRYGNDMPEASLPSRFLEEIPAELLEDLSPARGRSRSAYGDDDLETSRHYSYEDEDQSHRPAPYRGKPAAKPASTGSLDNIAQFFSAKGKPGYAARPKLEVPAAEGATGFKSGQRVRHPKYGDGVVFRTEGDGELTKVTVQFAKFGVKKLVEKFANLERV